MSVHHVHGLGTLGANGQLVDAWSLGRDNAGRITAKTETVDGITNSYGYSYDTMGRLRTVTRNGSLVEDYQYDGSARRSYEFNSLRGTPGKTYDYSTEDHLLAVGDTAYQYDFDGFLTARTRGTQLTQYFYSSRGELLGVVLPNSTVVEYIDEPLGRRIAKKVNGVVVEKYLWQGMTRLLAVYDGSNNLVTRFLYADARMPVAMTAGGVTYYLGYDQVGTLRAVSDVAGNVVKRIDYDSFGNIISDTNPAVIIPFGFAGGLHDRDTGLVRFGFRDYDPDIGRWTAKDRIGFGGGDADLYGYVLNNPVMLVDPIGLELFVCVRKARPGYLRLINANHAYLWDSVTEQGYGMASSLGGSGVEHGPEAGPVYDACSPVKGSEGKEAETMDYMRQIADTGLWDPPSSDCFTKVEDALRHSELTPPPFPARRAGAIDVPWW